MVNSGLPKAGVYFSHYECFGHTSRAIAVGEIFKKSFPQGELFFIQSGIQQPMATTGQLGWVHALPGKMADRRQFRKNTGVAEEDVDQRSQACLDIIIRERPDLFITEFFPLGREECRHELIPSLVKVSRQGAALWAVAGYPLLTGTNNEWRQKILKLYQKIIIFSPPQEKGYIADSFPRPQDRQRYLDFFERNAPKITFAGYLLPRQEVVVFRQDVNERLLKPPVPQGACRVAVVRGGGAVYPNIIAQAIRASDLLGNEYYFTVVAGPSTTPQEWYLFNTLVARKTVNNLILLKMVGDYEGLIKESDVCVATAGYHTSVMLLKYKKKAIVIPFEGYGTMKFHEQPARGVMLKEMIGAKILSIKDLTANTLAATVRKAAACKEVRGHAPKEWFRGGEILDKALIRLFGQ